MAVTESVGAVAYRFRTGVGDVNYGCVLTDLLGK